MWSRRAPSNAAVSRCSKFPPSLWTLRAPQVVTTRSVSRPTPAWAILDEKKEAVAAAASGPARMTTQERCPKCDHPELLYYTMQLRSADEGQTVFYECPQCNHNFSVNN